MKVLVRADMNKTVATGHVMRCLSIADALTREGAAVSFATASEDPGELIRSRGYECEVMNTDFSRMEDEVPVFKKIIEKLSPDIIIVDSYYVTEKYFCDISGSHRLVYVDDYCKVPYSVDIMVNYNVYGNEDDYKALYSKTGVKCPETLCGIAYAPLRKEFIDASPINVRENAPYEVLVTTGGADGLHMALSIAGEYIKSPLEGVRLNLLVGAFSRDRELLERMASENGDSLRVFCGITDMPAFLKEFDLALSAAGSTSYELALMGIPTMLFAVADNQCGINETFAAQGLMESAGNAEEDKDGVVERLMDFINKALPDYKYRLDKNKRLTGAVDGNGAARMAQKLLR